MQIPLVTQVHLSQEKHFPSPQQAFLIASLNIWLALPNCTANKRNVTSKHLRAYIYEEIRHIFKLYPQAPLV